MGAILTTYVRLYSRYHKYYYSSHLYSTVKCPIAFCVLCTAFCVVVCKLLNAVPGTPYGER
jgi:hypothetical protein